MQVIRGLHNLRFEHRGCVATIGNFDGVHLGHQEVFRHLRVKAEAFRLPATVVTFEPQPQEFFSPGMAPARLTRLREKLLVIQSLQIQRVVVLEFGPKLAAMPPAAFVRQLLVDGLGVKYLFIGDDFRFGRNRSGSFTSLREAGEKFGFGVENMNTFAMGEERVSSTRIRDALAKGELGIAQDHLGRPYRICGRVAHGDARGRTIGFPTANIDLHRKVSPLRGVFAVQVRGLGEAVRKGVANIGTRPTVEGDDRYLLEVHLFDFDRSIYGEHIEVEFCRKLRDEKRFDSFAELKEQIVRDSQSARAIFGLPDASAQEPVRDW